MTYTEKKKRDGATYFYRVRSFRDEGKVRKERRYMGRDLEGDELERAERESDMELEVLGDLLSLDEREELDRIRERYRGLPMSTEDNRYETFVSRFTHDSTAIEGNTLTLRETSALLFESITPASKELREVMEVMNHRTALDHLLSYDGNVSEDLILRLHEMVVNDTLSSDLRDQIGCYRTLQVYIRGVEWMPPAPADVPDDMRDLMEWYRKNGKRVHPVVLASYFHVGFETVHPFIDGNGRVGRLLMNFILHRNGFPMVNIPVTRRMDYYRCLEQAQVEGDLRSFVELILEMLRGSDPLY